jgi:hypothetical protein
MGTEGERLTSCAELLVECPGVLHLGQCETEAEHTLSIRTSAPKSLSLYGCASIARRSRLLTHTMCIKLICNLHVMGLPSMAHTCFWTSLLTTSLHTTESRLHPLPRRAVAPPFFSGVGWGPHPKRQPAFNLQHGPDRNHAMLPTETIRPRQFNKNLSRLYQPSDFPSTAAPP